MTHVRVKIKKCVRKKRNNRRDNKNLTRDLATLKRKKCLLRLNLAQHWRAINNTFVEQTKIGNISQLVHAVIC